MSWVGMGQNLQAPCCWTVKCFDMCKPMDGLDPPPPMQLVSTFQGLTGENCTCLPSGSWELGLVLGERDPTGHG